MKQQLNKTAYQMEPNQLIYDFLRPIDAKNVIVKITSGKAGVLKRGQVIDFDSGMYSPHTEGGTASGLVTDDVTYDVTDENVVVSIYITGNFRALKVVTDVSLTETDVDNLRIHGIFLK